MLDLLILVRTCYVQRAGQNPQKPARGERAAFERLRKAGLLYTDGAGHHLPTQEGERRVQLFADALQQKHFISDLRKRLDWIGVIDAVGTDG